MPILSHSAGMCTEETKNKCSCYTENKRHWYYSIRHWVLEKMWKKEFGKLLIIRLLHYGTVTAHGHLRHGLNWMHAHLLFHKKEINKWIKKDSVLHLLIDGFIAVPSCHCLQHAAQETAVTARLVLSTARHRVDDIGEDLRKGWQ